MELREAELAASARGIVRRFATLSEEVVALDHVDADVYRRRMTVIAGASGSGKSTLLSLFCCDARPDEGSVRIGPLDVTTLSTKVRRQLRRSIGVVLPHPSDNLLDRYDIAGNISWAAKLRGSRPDRSELERLMGVVGLVPSQLDKRPRQLSGGEQQRAALAAAIVAAPAIVVADEPTASLDQQSAGPVIAALRAATDHGAAVIVASHDPAVIDAADDVIHLHQGRRV